jgi:hypothetical protein
VVCSILSFNGHRSRTEPTKNISKPRARQRDDHHQTVSKKQKKSKVIAARTLDFDEYISSSFTTVTITMARRNGRNCLLVVSLWGLLVAAVYADVATMHTGVLGAATTPRTTTTTADPDVFHEKDDGDNNNNNNNDRRSNSRNINNNKDNNSTVTTTHHRTSNSIPNQIWDVLSSMVQHATTTTTTNKQKAHQPPPASSSSSSSSAAGAGACRSYLAPSTLPGAGLGMFAGRNFHEGDHVTTGDAVVPLLDVDWNNYYKNKKNFLWGTFSLF